MNFSFSGVIIIDKFGFTSRRFECNAKILATILMVADIFISLFILKYSAVPTSHSSAWWRYALWFSILYRSFVKYLWSKNVSIHWRQMLGDCRSSQGCLENILILSALSCFSFLSRYYIHLWVQLRTKYLWLYLAVSMALFSSVELNHFSLSWLFYRTVPMFKTYQ